MEYRDELQIAKKAEQMLTSALQHRTKTFAQHYKGKKEGEVSLKDAFAKAKTKKYGRKRDGNQQIFMRSLSIRMARHGFVQHYGVDTIRKGGERKREKPRSINYFYRPHNFKMRAQPFLSEAIAGSKVVEYVSENIGKLRMKTFGEELVFPLKQFGK